MKFLCRIAALAAIFAVSTLHAQNDDAADKKLVRVATLNSIQANQEFQRNVSVMQAQRQRIVELQTQLETAKAAEKAGIQKDIDDTLKKLNGDNQTMFKTYGYSLLRNYTLVVETAHIYMFVSDEEAAKIDKGEGGGAADTTNPDAQKLARVATLSSVKANQEFQRNVRIMQAGRDKVVAAKDALEKGTGSKKNLQKDLDAAVKKLNDDNQTMFKTYGYSLLRNYTLVVEKAHVFMFVSDAEAVKIEADRKK
ncbi:MAG: NADH:ubiquinone oxidoreductase subunit 6 (subunit J) [Rhodothermales bacterium]|jgi:NADH:ubiquinone oxidoreductase subunit 6 (subunit J)